MLGFLLWITQRGPTVLALGCVIGLLFPAVAAGVRPMLPVLVFLFILGTLLRVDNHQILLLAKNVKVSVVFPLLLVLVAPYVFGLFVYSLGADQELALAVAVTLAAPPASGNAAIARMLGLDDAMSLVIGLCSMALVPITAPLVVQNFGEGLGLVIDPWHLGLTLAVMIGGAEGVALLIRRYATMLVSHCGREIDGVVVLALFVFSIATMDGLQSKVIEDPLLAVVMIGVAYGVNVGAQLVFGGFCPGHLTVKLTLALSGGNRNVGLLWSALGATLSPTMALYFACCQLPIHTMPRILQFCLPRIKRIYSSS